MAYAENDLEAQDLIESFQRPLQELGWKDGAQRAKRRRVYSRVVASTLGAGKMTSGVLMFVRWVSEPDRDSNPRGQRPAVTARPLSISRPFSTVIIIGRLTSMKPPTFSRGGMVLIPMDGSNRRLGLIG